MSVLTSSVETVQRRWKIVRALSALLLLAGVFAGGLLALFALDNVLHLNAIVRSALGLGLIAAVIALAIRNMVLPLLKPVSSDEAALLIERAFPEMDNRLINAARLGRDPRTPQIVLTMIQAEAGRMVEALDLRRVLPLKALKPLATIAGFALLLFVVYAVALPDYFTNALKRYTMPTTFTPPITRTSLRVSPGNITVTEGSPVTIKAEVGGEIPAGAHLQCGQAGYDMRFLGGAFAQEFKSVDAPFEYCVRAGDAESETFRVTVLPKTKIEKVIVAYAFPEYLKLPAHTDDPSNGNIASLEATQVTLSIQTSKKLEWAKLVSDSVDKLQQPPQGSNLEWKFSVAKTGTYHFEWNDADQIKGRSSDYTLTALTDLPPRVRIIEPARDMTLHPSATLATLIHAEDDFALESVTLKAIPATAKEDKEAFTISEFAAKGKDLRISRQLTAADLKCKTGDTMRIFAVARDRKGSETATPMIAIHVIDDAQAKQEVIKELAALSAKLKQALAWQKNVRAQNVENKAKPESLISEQTGVHKLLTEIVSGWTNPETRHLGVRTRLENMVRGPAAKALEQIRTDRKLAADSQAVVIKELEGIIAELDGIIPALKNGDLEKVLTDATEKTPKQVAKDLLAGLKEFTDAQKKVIQDTMDMKPQAGENFSEDAKKKLDTLRQTEEKWGKFMQEKLTDLSKIPPQDFSNGSLSKELNKAFSEVQMAADALNQKSTELAIPAEESGLELAKEITSNIERWLANAPDNQKWNMEENMKDVDVPMADLPSQLEDIMGDLIDKEDKLAEESQDVTSSWLDSMDKGVGWGVGDGPIANMSAKGITGNLQPNSNEIAGRSGEGRSGKSSGQFVGDTAEGKGGKQTPTRSTPDPYEKGQVKDTSKDPSGGSTGGGKVSGANKEGLRGTPPPPTMQKMDRMADNQAEIRNTAEKARVALEKRGYVSQDLAAAIDRMKLVEDKLRNHQGANYTSEMKAVTTTLGAVKKSSDEQVDVLRDPVHTAPTEKRTGFQNSTDEEIPPEFKDWVKAYYKALSD
jgi:hypothetical protein